MSFRGIPSTVYGDYAEKIKPFLQHFEDRSHGRITADELEVDIRERDRQAWVWGDFQMVLLTRVCPEGIYMDYCAGKNRRDWVDEVDRAMKAWARELGKSQIFSVCRPGWSREAKSRGYKEIHREMVLELD